ncbi:ankyrin repeat domain-containing protein [Stenotrophomonas sp. SG1]|uniref:ankyrin repeat domain-containing protein n=1 Tax=Stenotrophomonas sp. SG1 TaxID=2944932 RepID=UPI0022448D8C|nr:ankyrin repeat domain-containing protein [Stenotrophomonas sp. SG1]MCW8340550.1 ankyrin repeat domain-containing protein [Stenotrophomonas sp. SG1]
MHYPEQMRLLVSRDSVNNIKRAVEVGGARHVIDGVNISGMTLLNMAIDMGMEDAAIACINLGADVTAGVNPITQACTWSKPSCRIVDALLDHGADVNSRTHGYGHSALYLCAANGHEDVAEKLLERGANPDIRTKWGSTPLHAAINSEMVSMLIASGADVNAVDKNICTPLHFFAKEWNVEAIELLVAAGADVNCRDDNGETTLMYSVQRTVGPMDFNRWNDCLTCLIDAGGNLNDVDSAGQSILHWAMKSECNEELVIGLLQRGADPSLADHEGNSAIDLAKGSIVEVMENYSVRQKICQSVDNVPVRVARRRM